MADYVLHVMSYEGIVPGAVHYRGRVEGERPRSCHGGTCYNAPESRGKTTCEQGHELPDQVKWVVEAAWTEERYNRWAARKFEGPGPQQLASEQEAVDTAIGRFLGTLPCRWWEEQVTPGQPGDKLWAGWVARPQDQDLTEENWGTVIAEVPCPAKQRTGDST